MKILFFFIFISSLLLFQLLFGWLVSTDPRYSIACLLTFTFMMSCLWNDYLRNFKALVVYYLLLPSLVYTIISFYIEDFARTLVLIVFTPFFVYLGSIKSDFISFIKLSIVTLVASLTLGAFIQPNFYSYYNKMHINDYFAKELNIELINEKREIVSFTRNEIIVLDFWTTSCGACFRDFPKYDVLTQKYASNQKIKFFSVNVALKNDNFENSVKKINSLNYSFENLFAKSSSQVYENLKIVAFPTVIIFKNRKIIYKGHPSYDKNNIVDNFEKEIEKALKEN